MVDGHCNGDCCCECRDGGRHHGIHASEEGDVVGIVMRGRRRVNSEEALLPDNARDGPLRVGLLASLQTPMEN